MDIIAQAMANKQRALTEHAAKQVLADYGIPVTRETLAESRDEAVAAAAEIGFPVVLKGSGDQLMHKTEAGVVFVNVSDEASAGRAFDEIARRLGGAFEGVLIQEMVAGRRELVLGLHREPQFGPCVMLGLGGVMTEILNDTAFRIAPFDEIEARDMASQLRAQKIFQAFRGEAPADMQTLSRCLTVLGRIGLAHDAVAEIDINPVIITPDGTLKAVDALIVLKEGSDDRKD